MNIQELMETSDDLIHCNEDVMKDGTVVAIMHGGTARLIDRFVKELAAYTSQPVDWHYFAGRAIILTTGNTVIVKKAISAMNLHCYLMDNLPLR